MTVPYLHLPPQFRLKSSEMSLRKIRGNAETSQTIISNKRNRNHLDKLILIVRNCCVFISLLSVISLKI